MASVSRITADGLSLGRMLSRQAQRIEGLEHKSLGTIYLTEPIIARNPETGVDTIFGPLPDGSWGIKNNVNDYIPPETPSNPSVTSNLGVINVYWDGLDMYGHEQVDDFFRVRVLMSESEFGDYREVGSLTNAGTVVVPDIPYNEPRFFMLSAVDTAGNESGTSAPVYGETIPGTESPEVKERIVKLEESVRESNESAIVAQNEARKALELVESSIGNSTSLLPNGSLEKGIESFDSSSGVVSSSVSSKDGEKHIVLPAGIMSSAKFADVPVKSGDSLRLSFWSKSESSMDSKDSGVKIVYKSSSGSTVKEDLSFFSGTTRGSYTNDWSVTTSVLKVPSDTVSVSIILDGENPLSDIHYDAFSLIDVTDAITAINEANKAVALAEQASRDAKLAQTSANGANTVWYLPEPPVGDSHKENDIWFDSDNNDKMYRWSGSGWVPVSQDRQVIIDSVNEELGQRFDEINREIAEIKSSQSDLSIEDIEGLVQRLEQIALESGKALESSNGKNTVYFSSEEPAIARKGDIWFTDGSIKVYSGDSWILYTDERLDSLDTRLRDAEKSVINGSGNRTTWSSSRPSPDESKSGDTWFDTSNGNSAWYFDGKSWIKGLFGTDAIKPGSVTSELLDNLAVTAEKLSDGSVTAEKIGSLAVGTSAIQKASITEALIADASITSAKIKELSAEKITSGTIDAGRIGAQSITADKLKAGTITAESGVIGSLDASKITVGTLNASVIGAKTIKTGHLGDGVVTTAQLASGAVNGTVIAENSITTNHIVSGTIKAEDIATGTITAESGVIGSLDASKITVGTLNGRFIEAGSIKADRLQVSTSQNIVVDPLFINKETNSSRTSVSSGVELFPGYARFSSSTSYKSLYLNSDKTNAKTPTFILIPGRTYKVSFGVSLSGGAISSNVYVVVEYKNSSGSQSTVSTIEMSNQSDYEYSGDFFIPTDSSSDLVSIYIKCSGGSSRGYIDIRNIVIQLMTDGTLITPDSITSENIRANSITSDKIVSGSIETQHIKSNAITVDKIDVSNELGAKLITSGVLQTSDKPNEGVKITGHGYRAWDVDGNLSVNIDGKSNYLVGNLSTASGTGAGVKISQNEFVAAVDLYPAKKSALTPYAHGAIWYDSSGPGSTHGLVVGSTVSEFHQKKDPAIFLRPSTGIGFQGFFSTNSGDSMRIGVVESTNMKAGSWTTLDVKFLTPMREGSSVIVFISPNNENNVECSIGITNADRYGFRAIVKNQSGRDSGYQWNKFFALSYGEIYQG